MEITVIYEYQSDLKPLYNHATTLYNLPDSNTAALEGYFSKVHSVFSNFLDESVNPLIEHIQRNVLERNAFSVYPEFKLKTKLNKDFPYLKIAESTLGRPDRLTGNLADLVDIYLPDTQKHALLYVPLLERFQIALVDIASNGSSNYAAHESLISRYTDAEKEFNSRVGKYFKGGVRDIAKLGDMLPNAHAVLTFNNQLNAHVNHSLLNIKYLIDIRDRLEVAATVLLSVKNAENVKPAVHKALARDAFSIAEIANTLIGRAFTIEQIFTTRDEVVAIVEQASA